MQSMYKKPLILLGFILLLLITGLVIPDEEKSEEEKFLTIEEINEIAEEKAEEYSDYDVLDLTQKDNYKGLETTIDSGAQIFDEYEKTNNRHHIFKPLLKAREYGASHIPDDEGMRKNLFIMDLLNLQTRLPQLEYNTVVPGIDYEEFQHLKDNLPSEFQKDKIKYERNKEEVDNLVNPASEFLASSKVDDIRASRVGSLRYDYMTATDKVEYKFTDEKTEVGFISSPDLINFKPNQTRLDFISITGFLIAKTTDEDNKFEIPADGNAYKIPVYLYLEETPAQLQDEKIDEKAYENDELSLNEAADKLSKEFSNIVHFEIIEDENLPVEEVNCERTLKYYFPYDTDKVKESKYYTEEFLDKLRSFPDYRGEDIRQENIKPARWHDQTPIVIFNVFSSANNHPNVSIDDPDKINNLFFY